MTAPDTLDRPAAASADVSCATADAYKRCSVFGAALVSTEVYDSLICLHGPQGCMQSVREAYAMQKREYDYCQTGMNQNHVIFGGETVLISSLLETMDPYDRGGPKILVSTCVPEIIGDDVSDVVSRVNPRLPIVGVSGGFRGDHYWGINETLKQLIMKFTDPYAMPAPGLVNLIGNIGGSMNWREDLREMKRLLEAVGLKVNPVACDSALENFQRASRAEATLLITPEIGLPAAQYLKETFDRKVVVSPMGLPLGLRGTEVWIRSVADALGLDKAHVDTVLMREEEHVRMGLRIGLNDMVFVEKTAELKKMPVAVVAEGVCALSWARFLQEELDTRAVVVAQRTTCSDWAADNDLSALGGPDENRCVLVEPSVDQVREALATARPQLVLGSSLEMQMVQELKLPAFMHIAHPNTHYVAINVNPLMGFRGVLHASETILNKV